MWLDISNLCVWPLAVYDFEYVYYHLLIDCYSLNRSSKSTDNRIDDEYFLLMSENLGLL